VAGQLLAIFPLRVPIGFFLRFPIKQRHDLTIGRAVVSRVRRRFFLQAVSGKSPWAGQPIWLSPGTQRVEVAGIISSGRPRSLSPPSVLSRPESYRPAPSVVSRRVRMPS
jgi:hypothetical protein